MLSSGTCLISTSLQRGVGEGSPRGEPFQRLIWKPLKLVLGLIAIPEHLAEARC